MLLRRCVGVALMVSVLFATGCQGPAPEASVEQLRPQWRRLALPAPPGTPGRLMVRDLAACAGHWYVTGGVGTGSGETRPAAWHSADGQTWSALRVEPKSYYGLRNVLYAAACRDGRVAVIGDKPGGAHGNPRVSTWQHRSDGSLVEVEAASFELYGGPKAVNVARLAAGPSGWLITGNRSSGAAVWLSPDAGDFEIIEAVPGLATDAQGATWASDAVATPTGWLLVGGMLPAGGRIDRDPLGWTSPDGRNWQRDPAPATQDYEEFQRVVLLGGTPVAVGLRGREFGAWRRGSNGWEPVGGFGGRAASGVPAVVALTVVGADRLLAVASDGASYGLWSSLDGGRAWRPVAAPVPMPVGAYQDVSVVALDDRVLLSVDDGREGMVWATRLGTGD
ncbi:hypothetical protein [Plantactinospora sp. B5E13]|uniref:hypothetical protein n=1 Tax=unclassified Plantactinospora TaxID=2631981 RepID=UPI00325C9141